MEHAHSDHMVRASPLPLICTNDGCWPSAYIVGAQKGATTSIFKHLQGSGLICGASGYKEGSYRIKEAHFYDEDDAWHVQTRFGLKNASLLTEYLSHYHNSSCHSNVKGEEAVFMDATPSYLREFNAPARMVAVMPVHLQARARFVMVLREPISRDISYYNMMRQQWIAQGSKGTHVKGLGSIKKHLCGMHNMEEDGKEFPDYHETVGCKIRHWRRFCMANHSGHLGRQTKLLHAYRVCALGMSAAPGVPDEYNRLTDGMYGAQLPRWTARFPRSHLFVLSFQGLLAHPSHHLKRIHYFFGLPAPEHHDLKLPKENSVEDAGKVAAPHCLMRKKLSSLYEEWNDMLYRQISKDVRLGLSPKHEPPFPRFELPECVNSTSYSEGVKSEQDLHHDDTYRDGDEAEDGDASDASAAAAAAAERAGLGGDADDMGGKANLGADSGLGGSAMVATESAGSVGKRSTSGEKGEKATESQASATSAQEADQAAISDQAAQAGQQEERRAAAKGDYMTTNAATGETVAARPAVVAKDAKEKGREGKEKAESKEEKQGRQEEASKGQETSGSGKTNHDDVMGSLVPR